MKTGADTSLCNEALRHSLLAGAAALLLLSVCNSGFAYELYTDGCTTCHGAFSGPMTPKGTVFPMDDKHEMHRNSNYMNTDCTLCHNTPGDTPFLYKCAGCHVGSGLRAHHAVNGITTCYSASCHSAESPPEEGVKPPYYGTTGTRVDNPCNDVLASNINENWSVGDFLGLDNDGDNLYDLADYSCGPLRMVEVIRDGSDMRIRWETAGGRTERVQATSVLTNVFSDLGSSVVVPGVGIVTQELVEVNGAVGPERFYRVRSN